MKFISLFSGIGGLDLGLERAGMECVAQVEIDDYCRRVLAKHWPDVLQHDDVATFDRSIYSGPVDIIAGGFPCQPHSVAGKQRGADDDRNLWPEYRRIVGEFQPRWVLAENVPGIKDTILDEVLSDLEGMDCETRTLVVPACAFDAPHIRYRVFIVAHAESAGRIRNRDVAAGPCEVWQRHDARAGGSSIDDVPHTNDERWDGWTRQPGQARREEPANGNRWATEPRLGGVDDGPARWLDEPGIPRVAAGTQYKMDRLRGLGNAVVPQVAEWIGRLILRADHS